MLFSKQIPQGSLIELCRALRHNLDAGLPIVRVLRQQAERGPVVVRPVAGRISEELQKGESLTDALRGEKAYFPPLFLQLTAVGEETGNLPEVLGELENYYLLQQRLWRLFISLITWPVVEFIASVLIIAGLLLILGIVADFTNNKAPIDPIGLGLGPAGAMRWLGLVVGSIVLVGGSYLLVSRNIEGRAKVDAFLLRVPVLGPTLMALALSRFCLALRLTLETGMPIARSLQLSLRATGNAAFEAAAPGVKKNLLAGKDLAIALRSTRLFPYTFMDMITIAEEGGRVPEMMRHQADYYEEELRRRMTRLTQVASYAIWLAIAILIIIAIFRIFLTMIMPVYSGIT
ncbi:MAG TPA: type II secretion system F family protein [Gemmataceae bacterium]|nr:type II secretion system F family protein [Gemmataceae bacterium]